jgi:uncharacterized membrane protein YccF (DUF307 family)
MLRGIERRCLAEGQEDFACGIAKKLSVSAAIVPPNIMSTLGNLIWLLCGGIVAGIGWFLAGIVMIVTIIGIPYARACFVIAKFTFCPFGRELIKRDELSGRSDVGTGAVGMIGNIIWIVLFGWWLALAHLLAAVLSAITIIGIPFALQHLKLAAVSFAPIGKTVVKKHLAEAARMNDAQAQLRLIPGDQLDPRRRQQSLPVSTSIEPDVRSLPEPSVPRLPEAQMFTVARGEQMLGEFTEAQIQQHLLTGFLLETDWFWNQATSEWQPLSGMPMRSS